MKRDRPRLIKFKPKGVSCVNCKYAVAVDARHDRYYCIKPNERSWVYYGEHVCGQGEKK